MANTDHSPETYAFAQAVASFEAARKDEVPSDWEEYVKSNKGDDTIKIWRKRDSASGLYLYKVIGKLVKTSLDDFRGVVGDLDYRTSWDVYTHTLANLQKTDPIALDSTKPDGDKSAEGDLIQWRVKFNFPFISDREYLFTRHVHMLDDTVVFLDKQADDSLHEPKKGMTRVNGYNNAICLKQVGEDVIMGQDYITALDLRMSLPNWLINWAAGAGVKGMLGMYRDAVDKYAGWKEAEANSDKHDKHKKK